MFFVIEYFFPKYSRAHGVIASQIKRCLGTRWQHINANHKKHLHSESVYTLGPPWVTLYCSSFQFACADLYKAQSICHLLCNYPCTRRYEDRCPSMNHLFTLTEIAKRGSYPAKLRQPKPSSQRFSTSTHLPVPGLGLNFFLPCIGSHVLGLNKGHVGPPSYGRNLFLKDPAPMT